MELRVLIDHLETITERFAGRHIDVEILDGDGFAAPVQCRIDYVIPANRVTVRLMPLSAKDDPPDDNRHQRSPELES